MRFYILGKKEKEKERVVASIGFGNDIAFYTVAENYEELMQKIKDKASWHFPGLLETKNAVINISRVYLNETSIPESIFNKALEKLPGRIVAEREIPPEIAIPLEFELAPVVGFSLDHEIDNPDILKRRNLLCKDEVFALEKGTFTKTVFVEINGHPFWKLVPRVREKKVKYIQARILSPQLLIENVISK